MAFTLECGHWLADCRCVIPRDQWSQNVNRYVRITTPLGSGTGFLRVDGDQVALRTAQHPDYGVETFRAPVTDVLEVRREKQGR
jgi:hypothetical protein